jgi:alpha-L-fucosidase
MKKFFIILSTIATIKSFALAPLDYTNKENTTKWLCSARYGLLFDWSARVNFESELSDSYDPMQAKGLQKGSLYSQIKDKDGNSLGIRNWENWNPNKFNPKDWIDILKASRAHYFVLTLNDRYGFLNFDSPATSLDSAATIWGVDIARALAIEAQKQNIPYFWSFQQHGGIDFILGHWLYFKSRWAQGIQNFAQYRKKSLYHIIKRLDLYGKCGGIYFSGNQGGIVPSEHPAREGEDPEFVDQEHSTYLKGLYETQPWMVISSEFYLKKDPYYHPTITLNRFKFKNYNTKPNRPDGSHSVTFSLESDLEGWANVSEQETRTSFELIHLLALAAGHNENLLIRVTPNNIGLIPTRQVKVLKELGAWLKRYEESILNTVNGPYYPGPWGVSTRKKNKIYLHILQHSNDGNYTLEALPEGIKTVKLLNTNETIKYSNTNGILKLHIPPTIASSRKEADMVVEITYPEDVDTTEFESLDKNKWKESLAVGETIRASQTSKLRNRDNPVDILIQPLLDEKGKGARKLYPRDYWSAPEPIEEPTTHYPVTVEVEFNTPKAFSAVSILEKNSRIKDWRVEYLDTNDTWHTIYEAENEHLAFFDWKLSSKVQAKKIRLIVLKSYGKAPQLRYFRIFE